MTSTETHVDIAFQNIEIAIKTSKYYICKSKGPFCLVSILVYGVHLKTLNTDFLQTQSRW